MPASSIAERTVRYMFVPVSPSGTGNTLRSLRTSSVLPQEVGPGREELGVAAAIEAGDVHGGAVCEPPAPESLSRPRAHGIIRKFVPRKGPDPDGETLRRVLQRPNDGQQCEPRDEQNPTPLAAEFAVGEGEYWRHASDGTGLCEVPAVEEGRSRRLTLVA